MIKILVFTIILFYLAMVLGIYIKLLDFSAPKSSMIYAFIIPFASLIINILAIKSILIENKPKNKYEFIKEVVKFILTAIRYSSTLTGMMCVGVCSVYEDRYILKYDFSNILNINACKTFDKQGFVQEISEILINA